MVVDDFDIVGMAISGASASMSPLAAHYYPTTSRVTGIAWMLGMGRFGGVVGTMGGAWLLGIGWTFGAIFSLLAFFLTTAFFRALRMRSAEAIVLLIIAFVVVIGQAPFSATPPMDIMKDITDWLRAYPVLAGTRAIAIGVAFGAIGISLRVLLGFDRPYME